MILSVVSGKGGVGKSFVTANLGVALAKSGFKTILVDADVKLANLEILLGLEGKPTTIQHVLSGEADLKEAIYTGPGGVSVLPAGLSVENVTLDVRIFDEIVFQLVGDYDYVIIDAPAGLDAETLIVLRVSENYLLVTNPELTALADAMKTKLVADKIDCNLKGVVVNMLGKSKGELSKQLIERALGKVIAVIPYDKKVGISISKGIPYVLYDPQSTITRQFLKLVSELTGVDVSFKVEGRRDRKRFGISIPRIPILGRRVRGEEEDMEEWSDFDADSER